MPRPDPPLGEKDWVTQVPLSQKVSVQTPEMSENALRGIEIEVNTLLKTFAPCKELGVGEGKEELCGL